MHIAYTAEQDALRQELRGYFAELVTPEVAAEAAAGETGGPGLPRRRAPDGRATGGSASGGPRSTAAGASDRSSSSSS